MGKRTEKFKTKLEDLKHKYITPSRSTSPASGPRTQSAEQNSAGYQTTQSALSPNSNSSNGQALQVPSRPHSALGSGTVLAPAVPQLTLSRSRSVSGGTVSAAAAPQSTFSKPRSVVSAVAVPQSTYTSSTPHKSLWEQAIEGLKPDDRKALDCDDHLSTLDEIIKITEAKKEECQEKRWKYTKKSNNKDVFLVDLLDGLLARLNKYASIVEIAIQHSPEILALPWAGFRFLLQIASSYTEIMCKISEDLTVIVDMLSRCAIYESLYIHSTVIKNQLKSAENLVAALPNLYAGILKYICSARNCLTKNTLGRIASAAFDPYPVKFQPLKLEIIDRETIVEKHARVAAEEFQSIASSEQKKDTLQLQHILSELRKPIEEIETRVNVIQKVVEDTERIAILKWLSDVTFEDHHEFIKSNRQPGSGKWLLERPDFVNWKYSAKSSILWLHGIAGAGKSKLASSVIDDIGETMVNTGLGGRRALAYFYCNYKETIRRDPASILRTLVKQLSYAQPELSLFAPVLSCYEKRKNGGFSSGALRSNESQDLIVHLAKEFQQIFIIIDALDECDNEGRSEFLIGLKNILSSVSCVKIFVTSRDDQNIVLSLEGCPNIWIDSKDNEKDIELFINTEVEKCISLKLLPGKINGDLKNHIITTLIQGAHGMFLWVQLQIWSICKQRTLTGLKKALESFPTDLNDTYSEIMRKINNQPPDCKDCANRALQIMLCSQNPLSPEAVIGAACIEPTERIVRDKDDLDIDGLLDMCQNLVVVDKGQHVFRFAHLSVNNFLQKHFGLENAHKEAAEICITLLCHTNSTDPGETCSREDHPLHNYSIQNWQIHARFSGETCRDRVKEFLTSPSAFNEWVLYVAVPKYSWQNHHFEGNITPFYVACYYQLWHTCKDLLYGCMNINVDTSNKEGMTSLHWAAKRGHEAGVKILLDIKSLDVDSKDTVYGLTPLSWATEYGHGEVVKMLLDTKSVDVDSKSNSGQTPLSFAAVGGNGEVVKMLLDTKSVDVDSKSGSGQTPLSFAARQGHGEVVKMLLDTKSVDVDSKSNSGQTPLSFAAVGGNGEVVKMLLDTKSVDVDSKSDSGETPLSFAAWMGHGEVVKMLLDTKSVDVDSKSDSGETPLSFAAWKGHGEVVKILLDTKSVDFNSKSNSGRTPLSFAAWMGHGEVVKLLLNTKSVDVDSKDKNDRTPLSFAAWKGHGEVVKMLLDTKSVDVDSKDTVYGQTPLSFAAECGHGEVVKLLLDTKSVDVNSKDKNDRTPLSFAAAAVAGHGKVVKMLLDTKSVDVDSKDKNDRTPLSFAAAAGHGKVVKMLLDTKSVDVDSKSDSGKTPLSFAAKNGHGEVVKMLLDTKSVDVDSKDTVYGQTPLSWAAEDEHGEVMKMLLDAGALR